MVNVNEHNTYEVVKRLIDNHNLRNYFSESLVNFNFNAPS